MIILVAALLGVLFLGGHSSDVTLPFEQTSKLIKESVADSGRRDRALGIIDQMKKTQEAAIGEQKPITEALNKVLDRRLSTSDEIRATAQPMFDKDAATAEKLLDLRFELKTVLTQAEWGKVFPQPSDGSKN